MFKKLKLTLGALTLSLGLAFATTPVQALDCLEAPCPCMPDEEETNPDCIPVSRNSTTGAIEEPTDPSTAGGEVVDPTENDPEADAEVEAEEEEAGEPAMWPTYLSLGALGATFILIIIINLASRRKK